jgi:hypothetical protein
MVASLIARGVWRVPELLLLALCASCGGVAERRAGDQASPPPVAGCDLETGFADDDACLAELDPATGFSLHFGPDDYGAPDPFLLDAGDEEYKCAIVRTPTVDPIFVQRWVVRSRSNVIAFELLAAPEGVDPCKDHRARLLAARDGGKADIRVGAAPEYAGAAMRIGPDDYIAIQVHGVNATSAPALREVWVNAYTVPRIEVHEIADTLALMATEVGGERGSFGESLTIPTDRPLLGLNGHTHPDIDSLEVFHVRGAERTLIYRQRGDGSHFLRYDSVSKNPVLKDLPNDPYSATGASGPVILAAGDLLEWSCDYSSYTGGELPPRSRERTCGLRGWYLPSEGHWVHEQ